MFTAPQEVRLKLDGTDMPAAGNSGNRTMYNNPNKTFNSFNQMKNND